MASTKISAPWYTYQKKLKALFEGDEDIEISDVEMDKDFVIHITVKDHEKFLALRRVLRQKVNFGNVTLSIILYDISNSIALTGELIYVFGLLFEGNPNVRDIASVMDQSGTVHGYVCFEPEVIQFFNDDISDVQGKWNGLLQDIAKDVFVGDLDGVNFCTALKEKGDAEG